MNIFDLLGINNPEAFVPVFVIILVAEIILVILIFRLIRVMKRKKAEKELRRKRLQKLKELQAAKARREAEARSEAETRRNAEARREAEAKEQQEAEEKAVKAKEEAENAEEKAEAEARAKVVAEAMAEKEAAEKAAAKAKEDAKEQPKAETKPAEEQQKAQAKEPAQEAEPAEVQQEAEEKAKVKPEAKKSTPPEATVEKKEKKAEPEAKKEEKEVVIDVRDVTMTFRTANNRTSGIKDYLIQRVKGQIHYREFTALRNISFKVYKGEVVGVIGTNGSGKSTILKIVSGALRPTSGEVIVDRRKLQLLTLGTGFDGELTGRENVYLNGSIIGYTKEFLDEHFDQIIEFAELQDFVDEKVKTYSSGMVSRLGFAIATAGEAAEILILDEVLSVGDEFFRQKSLARIKEMIHGGSTVLLVSHSLPTIRNNCDRVVWIEKGDLKMVGRPKVVCNAYQKMNSNGPNKGDGEKVKQEKKKK